MQVHTNILLNKVKLYMFEIGALCLLVVSVSFGVTLAKMPEELRGGVITGTMKVQVLAERQMKENEILKTNLNDLMEYLNIEFVPEKEKANYIKGGEIRRRK